MFKLHNVQVAHPCHDFQVCLQHFGSRDWRVNGSDPIVRGNELRKRKTRTVSNFLRLYLVAFPQSHKSVCDLFVIPMCWIILKVWDSTSPTDIQNIEKYEEALLGKVAEKSRNCTVENIYGQYWFQEKSTRQWWSPTQRRLLPHQISCWKRSKRGDKVAA